MNEIKWWESKTVWFNVVMTVLDVLTLLQESHTFGEHASVYFILAQGVGNIVLRVWFTNQPIEKSLS